MTSTASRPAQETLAEWIDRAAATMDAADLFFGHGTATAHDEACWIASHALGLAPDFDDSYLSMDLRPDDRRALDRLVDERVASRKPLAYLIGEAWFAGLRFEVDENTLVPRSPLAEVVLSGLLPWLDLERPLKVLDVGTGSGCVAVSLAHYWPQLEADAVDVSESALTLAAGNAARLGVADRVSVFASDVYDGVGERRYDLIVSNPPYVPNASMEELPDEYRHEPELALRAGDDGLDIVRRLLAGAADHLTPGGFLLMEVGEAQPQTEALLGMVEAIWLEFEYGGEGVVLLDRAACLEWRESQYEF